jgi:hypothetical protein
MQRAATFAAPVHGEPESRPRRGSHQAHYEDEPEDDRPQRRSRRTRSPEPIPPTQVKYAVREGKTQLRDRDSGRDLYYDGDSPSIRKSHGQSSSAYPKVEHEYISRPPMQSYGSSGFGKVKTSKNYTPDDVQWSGVPRVVGRETSFAY